MLRQRRNSRRDVKWRVQNHEPATLDERLNTDTKHAISTKVPVRTKTKLKNAAQNRMDLIGQSPERVRACFRDPRVKYAA